MKLCRECKNRGKKRMCKYYTGMSNYAEKCKDFEEKKRTNANKIRSMSDEELADFMYAKIREERNKAIDDFAETIKTSQEAHLWYCSDHILEFCNGDNCEECSCKFTKQIDEIAEQLKKDGKNDRE